MGSKSAPVLQYLAHLMLATFGVGAVVFGIGYPLAAGLDPQGFIINYFFVAPIFLMPAIIGSLAGYFFGWRLTPLGCRLIPLPLLLFVAYVLHASGMKWASLLGTRCSLPDCYFQFEIQAIVTAPFIAACAYAVGSEVGRRRIPRKSVVPANWKAKIYVLSVIMVVVTLCFVQRFAHRGSTTVRIEWDEVTGFQHASVENATVSPWLRTIVAPLDQSIIVQSEPHIASELRLNKLKRATGCVMLETLGPLPVVLGIDHLTDSNCILHAEGRGQP